MRTILCGLVISVAMSGTCLAQFSAPLPQPISASEARREIQRAFVRELTQPEKAELSGSRMPSDTFDKKRTAFCSEFEADEQQPCVNALRMGDVETLASLQVPRTTAVSLKFRPPFMHSRDALSDYLRQSKVSEGLSVFSQFAANISDNEAFVITNVVRGLAGRAVFSTDYAAVVTKSSEADSAKRNVVESDKSTLIRMVNNGGTLVARLYGPMFAQSGSTMSSTGGVSLGGGVIGPIGEADKLHGVGSMIGEFAASIAIEDLTGSAQQTAALLFGLRGGYARSDAALISTHNDKGIGFGQFAIGLRKNGEMSLSILLTQTQSKFSDLLPRIQVNFAALR